MMRWIDPSIELAAAGSSGRRMPTFGAWEDTVLQHTFDQVEYISLHTYLNNYDQDTPAFLASVDLMDNFIDEVVAIADAVAARRRSSKRIMLSFDEWNVWYRTRRNRAARVKEGWPVAPPILEEIYNMEDALAFGGCCISLLNHADRVTAACLAQLVNVIAPIMTETGGPAWRQTIFHPFAHFSRMGRGRVMRTEINSPTYSARYNDPQGPINDYYDIPAAPYLKLSAVHDDKEGSPDPVRAEPQPRRGDAARGQCGGLLERRRAAGAAALRPRPQGGQHQGRARSDQPEAARQGEGRRPARRGDAGAGVMERDRAVSWRLTASAAPQALPGG